jgi:hypothetical protein
MTTPDTLSLLRRGLLALLALGCVGALSELVLLEHYEEWQQMIPLSLLAITLVVIIWHWTDNRRQSLRVLQAVMLLLIIAGSIGVFFHIGGNYEFERELEPEAAGFPFWLEVIRGAAPTLAPGTLVQFGLIGLLYAYRHPLLNSSEKSET